MKVSVQVCVQTTVTRENEAKLNFSVAFSVQSEVVAKAVSWKDLLQEDKSISGNLL